eukprot:CAMPEP_0178406044 /NCGR_PEP_ID=MMETSP0689_2-20121128/18710_1 /TAXON_ID=160604 /ORGANISM="Amphidinium massartii, Strain CS-259" /LENGTH=316 /DNA_ID=CAMNT_0020027075 /DNA_START=55 /DNA_END=1005 /DNA_ORIENTATION=-
MAAWSTNVSSATGISSGFLSYSSTTSTTTFSEVALTCTDFVRYPGYVGTANVSGKILLVRHGNYTQDVYWSMDGADPTCLVDGASANQCGVHVHKGTSCDSAADIGGHYYDHKLNFQDPWQDVRYRTDPDSGRSQNVQGISVSSGYPLSKLAGHVMVVHDSVFPGERVACCVIRASEMLNLTGNMTTDGNETVIRDVEPVAITRRPWWVVVVWCLAIVAIGVLMCFALPCGGSEENADGEAAGGTNAIARGKGLAKKVKDKFRRTPDEADEDMSSESREPLTAGAAKSEVEMQSRGRSGKKSAGSCIPKFTPCSSA